MLAVMVKRRGNTKDIIVKTFTFGDIERGNEKKYN